MAESDVEMTPAVVDEYFNLHLPYKTSVMLAHYKMTHDESGRHKPWTSDRGPVSWLRAAFEASLIMGRMYLNVLGIGAKNNGSDLIAISKWENDDIGVEQLGGKRLTLEELLPGEASLFLGFIIMANKASAHLTKPREHDWNETHEAIRRIHHYLQVNLYGPAGRDGLESLPPPSA